MATLLGDFRAYVELQRQANEALVDRMRYPTEADFYRASIERGRVALLAQWALEDKLAAIDRVCDRAATELEAHAAGRALAGGALADHADAVQTVYAGER